MEALDKACGKLGYPKAISVDQGAEFVSRNLDLCAYARGFTLDFSWPGKSADSATSEPSTAVSGLSALNAHWYLTLADAAERLKDWCR